MPLEKWMRSLSLKEIDTVFIARLLQI